MPKISKKKMPSRPEWNLGLLYKSPSDPQIEKDVIHFEKLVDDFAKEFDVPQKKYLSDSEAMLKALTAYEESVRESEKKFALYFYFFRDIDASNRQIDPGISRLEGRMAQVMNKIAFFKMSLGQITSAHKKRFISDPRLKHFQIFLSRIFDDSRYQLSLPEEKIMNLKSIPAFNMWTSGNERLLNIKTVEWKKKQLPLAQALSMSNQLAKAADRAALSSSIARTLKTVSPFSEAEINAIYTDKKINDDLRGFKAPYEDTVREYRNDPAVVENLVRAVSDNFRIAHRFHKIKAKLLKLKSLSYSDRAAKIGKVRTRFTFSKSAEILMDVFGKLDPRFAQIIETSLKEGRVDAYPRAGKKSGAYCWSSYSCPTFVLLNHTDNLGAFTTFAHEFGHVFHGEFSKSQGALYCSNSMSLAETASTLFQTIALDAIYDTLPDHEKMIVLHDRINDDIATIFRQIACFNFENDIHTAVRTKGYISALEIAELHNKNMQAYLGPMFTMKPDDGYYFVHWSHIRRFFYVYSYAYGQLVSKAMLRRYKADPSFWKSIEKFLSAGGKDSPENILKEIGIDVSKPDFWMEGLKEIEEDIAKLEKLAR